jgi:hypothetical protein
MATAADAAVGLKRQFGSQSFDFPKSTPSPHLTPILKHDPLQRYRAGLLYKQ